MSINSSLVRELREKSGAGMMDCKKALEETNENIKDALIWLRKKGLSTVAKKSSRISSEGLIATNTKGNSATLIEINSETDFVSRNEEFQNFVKKVSDISIDVNILDDLINCNFNDKKLIKDELNEKIAIIGENLVIRRMKKISVSKGVVVDYIHNRVIDNLGRIGVIIALESDANQEVLSQLGKKIAMHIAASSPICIHIKDLSPDLIKHEKDVLAEQAKSSGKPPEIIEKMVQGKLKKYYEEVVLYEQKFVMNTEMKVKDVIDEAEKNSGFSISLTDFGHFVLGHGIQKENKDFASEVAAQLL